MYCFAFSFSKPLISVFMVYSWLHYRRVKVTASEAEIWLPGSAVQWSVPEVYCFYYELSIQPKVMILPSVDKMTYNIQIEIYSIESNISMQSWCNYTKIYAIVSIQTSYYIYSLKCVIIDYSPGMSSISFKKYTTCRSLVLLTDWKYRCKMW